MVTFIICLRKLVFGLVSAVIKILFNIRVTSKVDR